MNRPLVVLGVLILVGCAIYTAVILVPIGPRPQIPVEYLCNAGKKIQATLYEGKTHPPAGPGMPPTPGGSAAIVLSDGRAMTLAQTLSADGVRYANADESFVFWSKGNGAIVLEGNEEKSYKKCITVADQEGDLTQVYHGEHFTIRLPADYTPNAQHIYSNIGPGKEIKGTSFVIGTATHQGTNLSDDTYLSIEEVPSADYCAADLFLTYPGEGMATDGHLLVASSTDAAAGNRYEETVFALPGTSPCLAVRYFIHYSVFENYPPGAVKEFDKAALLKTFDMIRHTLVVAP